MQRLYKRLVAQTAELSPSLRLPFKPR